MSVILVSLNYNIMKMMFFFDCLKVTATCREWLSLFATSIWSDIQHAAFIRPSGRSTGSFHLWVLVRVSFQSPQLYPPFSCIYPVDWGTAWMKTLVQDGSSAHTNKKKRPEEMLLLWWSENIGQVIVGMLLLCVTQWHFTGFSSYGKKKQHSH